MLITWIICFSVVARWQVDIGVVHSLVLTIRFLLRLASLLELWRMQSNHNISLCFNSDYNSTTKKIVCFCCVLYFRADVGYTLLAVFVISMSPRPSSPLTMSVSSQRKRPREPGGGLSLAQRLHRFLSTPWNQFTPAGSSPPRFSMAPTEPFEFWSEDSYKNIPHV